MKRFSEEWFKNKMKQYKNMMPSYPTKLTATKGYKADLRKKDKREQRIESLYKLAEEKRVKLDRINIYEKTF